MSNQFVPRPGGRRRTTGWPRRRPGAQVSREPGGAGTSLRRPAGQGWRCAATMALVLLAGAAVGVLPLSAQAPPPPATAQEQGELRTASPPPRASWTSDRHALVVGDLVTILVDESTLATSDVRDLRTQNRSRDLGVEGAVQGEGGAVGASSRADLSDRTRGESVRRERFATEISARVVEEGPGGVMRVEGERRVRIDGHEQIVAISGWLRPADLSGRNTVESWRLADVSVRYGASGDMRRVRGLWGRLIGRLWP